MEATAAKLISEGYYEGYNVRNDDGHLVNTQGVAMEVEIDPSTGTTTAIASGTDTGINTNTGTNANVGSVSGADTSTGANAGSGIAGTSVSTVGGGTAGGLTPKDVMISVDKDLQATRMYGDMTMVEW